MTNTTIRDPEIKSEYGNKIIHYCWFGGKPLSKLAKKCLKSWQEHLPDYKIIRWDESSFDVNITKFSAEAYRQKKWAFVADVARCYALKKYGGLYFDTDMFVSKDISHILDCGFASGWESEYNVAAGIIWVRDRNNEIMNRLWDYYINNPFELENVYAFSIPTLLTGILQRYYGLEYYKNEIQRLRDDTVIYTPDYFYPKGSDGKDNSSVNSCTIHFYLGSWLSRSDRIRASFKAVFGEKLGYFILRILIFGKSVLRRTAKLILYPIYHFKRKKDYLAFDREWTNAFDERSKKLEPGNALVLFNKNWFGISIATRQLFPNALGIEELHSQILTDYVAQFVVKSGYKLVVFSGFAIGWSGLLSKIRELDPEIEFKVLWHGGMALTSDYYDWEMLKEILSMLKLGEIKSIGFVKKSMYEFFKCKGYNVEFVANRVSVEKSVSGSVKPHEGFKIGLYASGDRWVKNFYNQLCAASLFENAEVNCVPISDKTVILSKMLGINLSGSYSTVEHDKLLRLMAANDVNFYTTFTECAPVIPLESLEVGVPCITGNNHHYWEGTELEKYLVVDKVDDIDAIYQKALFAVQNKARILELYAEWKVKNDAESIESAEKFIS